MTDAPKDVTGTPRGANGHAVRTGERQLSAQFPDFVAARAAIEQLEASGLEAATMAFDRDSMRRAERSDESGGRDERFVQRAVTKLRRGVLLGALVGAVAGVVMGFALFADGPAAGVLASVIGATAAGGLVGVALGGIWNHQQSPAWEETFEAPDAGDAVLHIRVTSDEEQRLVEGVLAEHDGKVDAP